jgi:hypothetical protein
MFAIPGMVALVTFIYLRPQEVVTGLQRLPLLYLFVGLALFGLAVDLRLRVSRPEPAPQMPWLIGLWLWGIFTVALAAPGHVISGAIETGIALTLFVIVAHSVQSFRMLQLLAGVLLALAITLASLGVHQGMSRFGCVQLDTSNTSDLNTGTPDGRFCDNSRQCLEEDPEPGAVYMCERVGLLGTTSVGNGRVRYRGVLQDPNELALSISIGLAFALALFDRKRGARRLLLLVFATGMVLVCVMFTQSRGGQLVFLTVMGTYFIRKYGWKGAVIGAIAALPVLLLAGGGGERSDAEGSTEERMEALMTGLEMFRGSPIWGVGQGQFTDHHFRTAHNAYVLAAAEMGLVGLFLWTSILYISVKIPFTALRRYANNPAARVAASWSVAMLAALLGLYIGSFFLSFTYHYVMWIFLGMSGALYSAVRTHDATFTVRYGALEIAGVLAANVLFLGGLYLYLRLQGF